MLRATAARSPFVTAPLILASHTGKSRASLARQRNQISQFPSRCGIHVEARLEELGIVLPKAPIPAANYNIFCHAPGNMLYLSGHLPLTPDGTLMTGAVGEGGKTLEEGKVAARYCGLNMISTLKKHLGDLDRVEQVVKVFGIVNSTTDFKHHHKVMDGCSDLMIDVFGKPVGYHARSAIGTSTLPLDIMVEVEAIVQIKS